MFCNQKEQDMQAATVNVYIRFEQHFKLQTNMAMIIIYHACFVADILILCSRIFFVCACIFTCFFNLAGRRACLINMVHFTLIVGLIDRFLNFCLYIYYFYVSLTINTKGRDTEFTAKQSIYFICGSHTIYEMHFKHSP